MIRIKTKIYDRKVYTFISPWDDKVWITLAQPLEPKTSKSFSEAGYTHLEMAKALKALCDSA